MKLRSTALLMLMFLVATGADAQPSSSAISSQMDALDGELRLHPEVGVTDVYKLLHQGSFGPGHAIADRDAAARMLADEMAALGGSENVDPLCQPIGGDPAKIRIHLRPFAGAGGDRAELLEAFVVSADAAAAGADEMKAVLERAVALLVRRGRFQLAGQLEDLAGRLAEEGYPPVHHSDGYVAAYRPAYRVILEELAEQRGWCQ